ncbi:MAG: two-component system response regulator CreB [Verrucomicrobia bacterium]|nr:MAG: two-component system response regulator CreB [Verrucomicrobiota bacterium]
MPRILIVEDEPAIADALIYVLKSELYDVVHVMTGAEALKQERQTTHDLAILDIGLPDMTGFELCRQLREMRGIPVLFLTARSEEIDRVLGLEIGGDDYVTKPFSPREVAARVKAILRRAGNTSHAVTTVSHDSELSLKIDESAKRIMLNEIALDLTAHEFRMASVLISHPRQVFSRDQLLENAWHDPGAVTDRTVDAHVKTLRAKLKATQSGAEEMIETRRGLGYSYSPLTL